MCDYYIKNRVLAGLAPVPNLEKVSAELEIGSQGVPMLSPE
jgi:hypothetical protein